MRFLTLFIISLTFFSFDCFAQKNNPSDSIKRVKIRTHEAVIKLEENILEPLVIDKNSDKKVKDSAKFNGLIVEKDERIDLLAKTYMESKVIKGYKVQIFSGKSRWEASQVKSEFISAYPDLPSPDLVYQAPNFKLRVGNYRDRFEAEKNLRLLKENFPASFLVKDQIQIEYKD